MAGRDAAQKPSRPPSPPAPHPLLAAGLALAAAGAPLAWTQVVVEEYTLPKLLCLALGVLVAAGGAAASLRRGAAPSRTPLDWPLLAGAAALSLSAWFSQDPWQSVLGEYNLRTYGAGTLALCAALGWLAAGWLDARGRRRTLTLCVRAAGLVGLYAALQGLGLEPFEISAAVLQSGRAVSTIGSPVHLGAFLALLLPVGLHLWRAERGPLPALCLALMAAGLWASISRGAWLAAGLGCALFSLLAGWRPRWGRGAWLALLLAGGAAAGLMGRKLAQRPTRDSDVARVEGWKVAWRIFGEHPWLGTGPDTFGPAFRRRKTEAFLKTGSGTTLYHADAHNDLLQALSTTGLAGTLAYLALLGALAWAARRALLDPERREEAAALSAGLVSLFLVMKLNPASIEVLALAAVLSGLLCAGQGPARTARASRAWAGLLLLFGALAAAAVLRLGLADRQSQLARGHLARGHAQEVLRHIRRACALHPAELKYRIIHVNQLMDLVRADRHPGRRAAWLAEAEASALEGLRRRPNDVNAPYIAGYVSLIWAQVGNRDKLPAAEAHLDAALKLDPTFLPLLEVRLDAARLRGDAAELERRSADVERVKALGR